MVYAASRRFREVRIADYDVLAVPSQWLETGPLVVLEAFAAGIPDVGSDLGGIAELVRHERDGLLVPADSIDAWRNALQALCLDRQSLTVLRNGIQGLRSMKNVATDMSRLYSDLLGNHQPAAHRERTPIARADEAGAWNDPKVAVLSFRAAVSRLPDAQVAQLVEQRTENPRVGGSIPSLGTTARIIRYRASGRLTPTPVALHSVRRLRWRLASLILGAEERGNRSDGLPPSGVNEAKSL